MTNSMSNFKMPNNTKGNKFLRGVAWLPLATAIVLAGCSSNPKSGSSVRAVTHQDALAAVDFWGKKYEKSPSDRTAALNFASALRRSGKSTQAVAVLRQASTNHTNDTGVQAGYGKALAAQGDLQSALGVIQSAQRPDLPDWRLVSAEGAILDQIGQHQPARERYQYALSISSNQPSVLSNLGMSYVLTGDLKSAETYLRQALKQPKADGRVRQNLSLIVGLQGRFEEAEQIARSDLPPAQAAANIAYLRSLLTQQNTWDKLKNEGKKQS